MHTNQRQWTLNCFVVLAEGDFASVRRECGTEEEARKLVAFLTRFGFDCSIVVKGSRTL